MDAIRQTRLGLFHVAHRLDSLKLQWLGSTAFSNRFLPETEVLPLANRGIAEAETEEKSVRDGHVCA